MNVWYSHTGFHQDFRSRCKSCINIRQQIQPYAMLMSVNLASSNPSVESPIDVILQ
jgi:hypothetical protein